MRRRRVIVATGLAATVGTGTLAGCSGDDGSGGDEADGGDGSGDGGNGDGTGTGGDGTRSGDDGGGSTPVGEALSVSDVDATDVDEPRTIVLEATVTNEAGDRRSGVVVGEAEVDDRTFTARRQVTVEAGGSIETALKVGYESDSSVVTYTYGGRTEDEEVGEPSEPIETGAAEDLVVVDVDEDSADAERTIEITAEVRNLVGESRRGELVGEVDLNDGGAFTDSVQIRVDGGATSTETVRVEYESESSFVTYSASAHVE